MDKKAVTILLKTIKSLQDQNLERWFYWDTYMQFITEDEFEYAKAIPLCLNKKK